MRKTKLIAAMAVIVILAAVLAGCTSSTIPKPTPQEGVSTFEITGYCDMTVEGSTITVTGETSFITGTLMEISIVAQNGKVIDTADISKTDDDAIEATFQITDDKYGDDVKIITAYITVGPKTPGKQISAVYSEYGNSFERISNDTVWNKSGNVVMFESEPYEF